VSEGVGFQMSPAIGKLAGALAKAQGAFESIGRTREVKVSLKTGGSYTFAYAPLDEVLRAVRPAMAANGLALVQTIADGAEGRTMTTTLIHESGEFIASTTTLPGQASTAQEFGSQVTYMRRYAIVSILGVVAEEDDDGNAAAGNDWSSQRREPPASRQRERTGKPTEGSAQPPKAATTLASTGNPIADSMVKAGITNVEINRWLLKLWGTANWNILQQDAEKMAITSDLGRAWAEGGDDGHAKAFAELKERIEAARAKKS